MGSALATAGTGCAGTGAAALPRSAAAGAAGRKRETGHQPVGLEGTAGRAAHVCARLHGSDQFFEPGLARPAAILINGHVRNCRIVIMAPQIRHLCGGFRRFAPLLQLYLITGILCKKAVPLIFSLMERRPGSCRMRDNAADNHGRRRAFVRKRQPMSGISFENGTE